MRPPAEDSAMATVSLRSTRRRAISEATWSISCIAILLMNLPLVDIPGCSAVEVIEQRAAKGGVVRLYLEVVVERDYWQFLADDPRHLDDVPIALGGIERRGIELDQSIVLGIDPCSAVDTHPVVLGPGDIGRVENRERIDVGEVAALSGHRGEGGACLAVLLLL